MTPNDQSEIVIAGMGNLLMRDDGVGIHAVRSLENNPPQGVRVIDVGTAILHALPLLEDARRVLVIDAVRGGGPPGSIYFLDASDAELRSRASSVHSWGFLEALKLMGRGPGPEIRVLGVEPAEVDYGMELSPAVEGVLNDVVSMVRRIVVGWRTETNKRNAAEKVA
jgi:hydrogenase maturation protease